MSPISEDIKIYKKEYRAFHDAKQRCNNKNHRRYVDWGGRGISFKFSSFKEFLNEIGPCPKNLSLDRINNDKNYEAGNIQWTSRSNQQHNKRIHPKNKYGITGVREVHSKGLVTVTYQAFTMINSKFYQLYTGPDFFLACCARKSKDNEITKK